MMGCEDPFIGVGIRTCGACVRCMQKKYTQPSMAIKYNNGICCGKLEQGNQSGTINVNYNGVVYHLIN